MGDLYNMRDKVLSLIENKNINFENLVRITMLDEKTLKEILQGLVLEEKIFLNSSNKYEFIKDTYVIGTLLRTSKGVSYIEVGKQIIYIEPEELHTALKYDKVVVEVTNNNKGSVKNIL